MAKSDLQSDDSDYTKQQIYSLFNDAFDNGTKCPLYPRIKCGECPFVHTDNVQCNLYMIISMGKRQGYI